MQKTLRKMREERADGDRGFTLIELLVVVVIIGVLVAIAIPVYLNYRKGAENKAAQSDVRNAVVVVEQCYTDNTNRYPTAGAQNAGSTALEFTGCSAVANQSSGVTLTYTYTAASATYVLTGRHTSGGATFTYSSSTGQTIRS